MTYLVHGLHALFASSVTASRGECVLRYDGCQAVSDAPSRRCFPTSRDMMPELSAHSTGICLDLYFFRTFSHIEVAANLPTYRKYDALLGFQWSQLWSVMMLLSMIYGVHRSGVITPARAIYAEEFQRKTKSPLALLSHVNARSVTTWAHTACAARRNVCFLAGAFSSLCSIFKFHPVL